MSKTYSGKQIKKILEKIGYKFINQKGSHVKLEKIIDNKKTIIIVPDHKTLKKGTLNNILKKTGLSINDLKNYL